MAKYIYLSGISYDLKAISPISIRLYSHINVPVGAIRVLILIN